MNPESANTTSATIPDTAEDIRDIHGLVEIPSGWAWLAIALGILLMLLAIAALVRRWRRPKPEPPPPAADAVAYAALERARQYMTPDDAERFGTVISAAIRHYIEARFDRSAPRRTTEEFLRDLTRDPSPDLARHVPVLESLLGQMDLVKFARAPLDTPQMEGLLESAREFVARTWRSEGADG